MSNIPLKISVLLPVYNGGKYLKEALDSICKQSVTDFELIIVNDNSTDNSEEVILSYSDKRIVYLKNAVNMRTAFSLNRAIDIAKGKYLVRMDQDDICRPDRFKVQYEFMESNPHIGISGGQMKTFGVDHKSFITKFPLTHKEILLQQLYKSPFAHPTVIFRKSVLEQNRLRYFEDYIAEDYSLWAYLLPCTIGANVEDVLLDYRIHPASITKVFFRRIFKEQKVIRLEYCQNLFKASKAVSQLLYSPSQTLRKFAIKFLSKNQGSFDSKLFDVQLNSLNDYFLYRTGWRYYMRLIQSKFRADSLFK